MSWLTAICLNLSHVGPPCRFPAVDGASDRDRMRVQPPNGQIFDASSKIVFGRMRNSCASYTSNVRTVSRQIRSTRPTPTRKRYCSNYWASGCLSLGQTSQRCVSSWPNHTLVEMQIRKSVP
jgi:hypothetical protein